MRFRSRGGRSGGSGKGSQSSSKPLSIQSSIVSGSTGPSSGPRGLIRLRYPVLPNGDDDLVNLIAIEPVVSGRRRFSELEWSELDGMRGKRLWARDPGTPVGPTTELPAGCLTRLDTGAKCLTIDVAVERFENGAHVGLTLTQRSDAPDELELTLHREPDSAPIEYCILTATMGNKARTRQLWLRNEVARRLDFWPSYKDAEFTPHRLFPLDRLTHHVHILEIVGDSYRLKSSLEKGKEEQE